MNGMISDVGLTVEPQQLCLMSHFHIVSILQQPPESAIESREESEPFCPGRAGAVAGEGPGDGGARGGAGSRGGGRAGSSRPRGGPRRAAGRARAHRRRPAARQQDVVVFHGALQHRISRHAPLEMHAPRLACTCSCCCGPPVELCTRCTRESRDRFICLSALDSLLACSGRQHEMTVSVHWTSASICSHLNFLYVERVLRGIYPVIAIIGSPASAHIFANPAATRFDV